MANAAIFAVIAEAAKLKAEWWSSDDGGNPWGSFGSMFADEPADEPVKKKSDTFDFFSEPK